MTSTQRNARILVFVAAIALVWVPPKTVLQFDHVKWFELRLAYWVELGLVAGWAALLVKCLRESGVSVRELLGEKHLVLVSVGLAGFMFLTLPTELKVLSDETNLLAVSQSMYEQGEPIVCTSGEYRLQRLECLAWRFDKRSNLFPFLIQIVHRLTGFREENVFIVNFLGGVTILLCVGLIAGRLFGRTASLVAPLCLASVPTMGQTFTSGGFETINLALLTLASLLWLCWHRRASRPLWGLLVVTMALLGHVRYESFAYVVAGVPIMWLRAGSESHRSDLQSWYSAFAPLALLPVVWRQQLFSYDLFQAGDGVPFSISHLVGNSRLNLNYLFSADGHVPSSVVVASLAALGAALCAYKILRDVSSTQHRDDYLAVVSLLGLTFVICWCVVSAYFAGDLNYPNSFRYALPLWPPLALSATWVLVASGRRLLGDSTSAAVLVPVGLAGLLLFESIPRIRDDSQMESLVLRRERRSVVEYLKNQAGRKLVVYTRPEHTMLSGYDTWSMHYAGQHTDLLKDRIASGQYARALLVWGSDCQRKPESGDDVLFHEPLYDLCNQTINEFKYQETARIPVEGGPSLLIFDLLEQ